MALQSNNIYWDIKILFVTWIRSPSHVLNFYVFKATSTLNKYLLDTYIVKASYTLYNFLCCTFFSLKNLTIRSIYKRNHYVKTI